MSFNPLWQAVGNTSIETAITAFEKIKKPSHNLF